MLKAWGTLLHPRHEHDSDCLGLLLRRVKLSKPAQGRVNSSARTSQSLSDCAKSLTEPAVILAVFFNELSTLSGVACKWREANGRGRISWPNGSPLKTRETSENVRVAWLRVKTSSGGGWQLMSAPPHAASDGQSVVGNTTFAEGKAQQIAEFKENE